MSRTRAVARALLPLLCVALWGGCAPEPKTAVLLIIDYGDVGQMDQLVVQAYPADRFDDIGFQEVPETPGAPLTGDTVSVLLVLPERWADRNMIISVVGKLGGVGVGHGTQIRSFVAGEVTELEIQLEEGAPVCGNGILEALEQCDGSDFRGDSCRNTMGLQNGSLGCTDECLLDVSGCFECGNSAIEAAEECDSDDFGGLTCADYFFDGGHLRCDTSSCTILTDECIGGCGNDLAEPGEACDGTDFGGQTCGTVAGLGQGQLGCTPMCQLDISGCHQCGNGAQEADEACDGVAFGGATCADYGYGGGVLTCDGVCQIDTSSCCGDGVQGPGEVCDGTDFGTRSCLSETGHSSGSLACDGTCQLDRSGCYSCGNGAVEGAEACDGDEFGGVSCDSLFGTTGPLTCAADCSFIYTEGCFGCGDGVVDTGEGCDDGNLVAGDGCQPDCSVQPGWTCAGQPSQCSLDTCNGGGVDPGEVCDGVHLSGETCFTQGYISGGGVLGCAADCTAYDYTNCLGGPIQNEVDLQNAVTDAYATGLHQVIRVPSTALPPFSGSISLDECGGPCGSTPVGVTIRPMDGQTLTITSSSGLPAFDVISGNNVIRDLHFSDVAAAIRLQGGTYAGGNVIRGNLFENTIQPPGQIMEVDSRLNIIEANRFDNATGSGVTALIVSEDGNTISMNVFAGTFTWTVMLHTFPAVVLDSTFFDHNSIYTIGAGGGVFLNSVDRVCFRNNIVYGDGTTTGFFVAGNVLLGSIAACISVESQSNVNANHLSSCTEAGCGTYCNGTSSSNLCDLTTAPGWTTPALCLSAGNPLIDGATVISTPLYDFNDGTPAVDHVGGGPDIGAREDGTTRSYGGSPSPCL